MATLVLRNLLLLQPPFLRHSATTTTTGTFSLRRPTLTFSLHTSAPQHGAVSTQSDVEERENVLEINRKREIGKLNLSVKEKKELGSYANSLGDKLKSQQVGKSGVTDMVAFAFNETLEKRELLKLKIHKSCPGELDDVIKQLEHATGSVAVFQIGRTVIFYRPSITKLKAEEKKEQARKLFAQKRQKAQAAFTMRRREQVPRRQGSNRYGSRRSENVPS